MSYRYFAVFAVALLPASGFLNLMQIAGGATAVIVAVMVAPAYRSSVKAASRRFVNLPRLFHTALDFTECELLFCSILDGEDGDLKMLDIKREYMPDLHIISKYTTY